MFTFLFVIIVPDRNEDQNEWIHRANLKSVPQESIIQMHKYCFVPDQLYDMLSSKCDQSERPEATVCYTSGFPMEDDFQSLPSLSSGVRARPQCTTYTI